jgi:hypothetical protein
MRTVLTRQAVPARIARWVDNHNDQTTGTRHNVVVGSLQPVLGHQMAWLLAEFPQSQQPDRWLICPCFMARETNTLPGSEDDLRQCPHVRGLVETQIAILHDALQRGPNPSVDMMRTVGDVPGWVHVARLVAMAKRREFVGRLIGPGVTVPLMAKIAFNGDEDVARVAIKELHEKRVVADLGCMGGYTHGDKFDAIVPKEF